MVLLEIIIVNKLSQFQKDNIVYLGSSLWFPDSIEIHKTMYVFKARKKEQGCQEEPRELIGWEADEAGEVERMRGRKISVL